MYDICWYYSNNSSNAWGYDTPLGYIKRPRHVVQGQQISNARIFIGDYKVMLRRPAAAVTATRSREEKSGRR
jgi:hypothetical protein